MIDFNHFSPQKVSMAVLKAQVFISSRLIWLSLIFKIISINQDLGTLAEKITNIPAVFSSRMPASVQIVIVFNCSIVIFSSKLLLPMLLQSDSAFFSLSICINPHPLLVTKCFSVISTLG